MNKKHILKQAFKTYFPDQFLEKSKRGFAIPVGDWLRGSLKQELLKFIDLKLLQKQSIFDSDYIITLVKNHIDSKIDNTFRVWVFYCFQKWYFLHSTFESFVYIMNLHLTQQLHMNLIFSLRF